MDGILEVVENERVRQIHEQRLLAITTRKPSSHKRSKHGIDNHNPKNPYRHIYQDTKGKYMQAQKRQEQRRIDNMLQDRLANATATGSTFENIEPRSLNIAARRRELDRINHENHSLLERLDRVVPTLPKNRLAQEDRIRRKQRQRLQQFVPTIDVYVHSRQVAKESGQKLKRIQKKRWNNSAVVPAPPKRTATRPRQNKPVPKGRSIKGVGARRVVAKGRVATKDSAPTRSRRFTRSVLAREKAVLARGKAAVKSNMGAPVPGTIETPGTLETPETDGGTPETDETPKRETRGTIDLDVQPQKSEPPPTRETIANAKKRNLLRKRKPFQPIGRGTRRAHFVLEPDTNVAPVALSSPTPTTQPTTQPTPQPVPPSVPPPLLTTLPPFAQEHESVAQFVALVAQTPSATTCTYRQLLQGLAWDDQVRAAWGQVPGSQPITAVQCATRLHTTRVLGVDDLLRWVENAGKNSGDKNIGDKTTGTPLRRTVSPSKIARNYEIIASPSRIKHNDPNISLLFQQIDVDRSGVVTYSDFMDAMAANETVQTFMHTTMPKHVPLLQPEHILAKMKSISALVDEDQMTEDAFYMFTSALVQQVPIDVQNYNEHIVKIDAVDKLFALLDVHPKDGTLSTAKCMKGVGDAEVQRVVGAQPALASLFDGVGATAMEGQLDSIREAHPSGVLNKQTFRLFVAVEETTSVGGLFGEVGEGGDY